MSKEHYDRGTRQLPILRASDTVKIQIQGRWVPGVVIGRAETTPHSYVARGPSGHEYRRNRKHLREVAESVPLLINMDLTNDNSQKQPSQLEPVDEPPLNENNRTSHGKTVRPPSRYHN